MRLGMDWYSQEAITAAPALLGKLLCRKTQLGVTKLRITETEAYYGQEDTACHAHKGKTKRTEVLYRGGGTAYVYLCYGIHQLFNVVTGSPGHPQAVLIRGVEGYNGPGRLTKALGIGREHNGEDLSTSEQLWIEDDGFVCAWSCSKRIGIDYATPEYRDKLWRFVMIGEPPC